MDSITDSAHAAVRIRINCFKKDYLPFYREFWQVNGNLFYFCAVLDRLA